MLSSRGRNPSTRAVGGCTLLKSVGPLILGRAADFLLSDMLARFEAHDARFRPSITQDCRLEVRGGGQGWAEHRRVPASSGALGAVDYGILPFLVRLLRKVSLSSLS
jgi:hypothetical protein